MSAGRSRNGIRTYQVGTETVFDATVWHESAHLFLISGRI